MIHEAYFFFFISLKYLSNNNMKEENLRLRLEKKMFVTTHKLWTVFAQILSKMVHVNISGHELIKKSKVTLGRHGQNYGISVNTQYNLQDLNGLSNMPKYGERARSDHSFVVLMLCAKDTHFFLFSRHLRNGTIHTKQWLNPYSQGQGHLFI